MRWDQEMGFASYRLVWAEKPQFTVGMEGGRGVVSPSLPIVSIVPVMEYSGGGTGGLYTPVMPRCSSSSACTLPILGLDEA